MPGRARASRCGVAEPLRGARALRRRRRCTRMSAFRRGWVADSALLGVVAIWGLTFPMIKDATRDGNVLGFVAIRFAIALLAFVPLLLRQHRRGVSWKAH